MLNLNALNTAFKNYKNTAPFPNCVVDNFLRDPEDIATEFLPFHHEGWFEYDSADQIKKACNNWYLFPKHTYQLFSYLLHDSFVERLSELVGTQLYADYGLHGGGWHCHGNGGMLKPHLDYNIHPKLALQRKINIILYVEPDMKVAYGGALGMWEGTASEPQRLVREVAPIYNRAVIFDTTQNSWHGMSRKLNMPPEVYRRSLAIYYLCAPPPNATQRLRAEFKDVK